MPLTVPAVDDRSYEELRAEALRRIPVHNPSWTNFNASDPGVTLVELFAFMTESLLYRANTMPDRNRRKFLSLLGLPLQPAASARGLVSFANERGPLETLTLSHGVEVRAGQIGFRTDRGLDVLPVEARVYYKRPITLDQPLADQYQLLYSSYGAEPVAGSITPYDTQPFSANQDGFDMVSSTLDNSLWIALLIRPSDRGTKADDVRAAIAGKVLSLGLVPVSAEPQLRLAAGSNPRQV